MGLFDLPAVAEFYHPGSNPLASVVNQYYKNATIGSNNGNPVGIVKPDTYVQSMKGRSSGYASTQAASNSAVVTGGTNSAKSTSSSAFEIPSDYANVLSQLQSISTANSKALSDAYANQNKIAMDFNASEAAKSRDWQLMMSNTAHQREIADLKAAGLNPVLSATGGNGAAVTSGATASGLSGGSAAFGIDQNYASGLAGLIGTLINANASMHNANVSAGAAMAAASTSANASHYAADQTANTAKNLLDWDKQTYNSNWLGKALGPILSFFG